VGIFFKIGNSSENENFSYNLFVKHFLVVPKIAQKPWPEPMALAFQDLRPGQSRGQAVTLARLGLAHGLKPGRAHHYLLERAIAGAWQLQVQFILFYFSVYITKDTVCPS